MRILSTGTVDNHSSIQKTFFDTNFAQWFQKKATHLLFNPNCTSLKKIEMLMQHIDAEYTLLYNITVKNRSKTFLGKLKPLTREEASVAEKYLHSIRLITDHIEELLENTIQELLPLEDIHFSFMEEITNNTDDIFPENKDKKSHSGARGACQD
jgi:hypothetical protein